jgi:hypothetical protein
MPTDGKFKYTRNLCRQYPGLFVILLDQSGSMSQPVEGGDALGQVGTQPGGMR